LADDFFVDEFHGVAAGENPSGVRLPIDADRADVDVAELVEAGLEGGAVFVAILVAAEGIPLVLVRLAPRETAEEPALFRVAGERAFVVDEVENGLAEESPVAGEFAGVTDGLEN
jgi:hypothetical protein